MTDNTQAVSNDISLNSSNYSDTSKKLKDFEKLELLFLKTLEIVMEYDENADLDVLENCLSIIDQIRGELTFLRAKIYKEIFRKKFASII